MKGFVLAVVVLCGTCGVCFGSAIRPEEKNRENYKDHNGNGRAIRTSVGGSKVPNQPGTLFGHDAEGNGISLGNWLDYSPMVLGVTMAGTLYLLAMATVPVYYTLFVVTHPTEGHGRANNELTSNNISAAVVDPISKPTSPMTEALHPSWSFSKALKMVALAFETYQQLDMKEMDCQKRIVCEAQVGNDFAASTARALSNVLMYFDFFKRYPAVEEYREAIRFGQRRMASRSNEDTCAVMYTKCKFSLKEFNDKYRRLLRSM